MDSVCCKMADMDLEYTPTHAEEMVANSIHGVVDAMLDGKIQAIGLCAIDVTGAPTFFYLNKPEEPVLRPALNKLMGLYEAGQQFKGRTNAPKTNRSYMEH